MELSRSQAALKSAVEKQQQLDANMAKLQPQLRASQYTEQTLKAKLDSQDGANSQLQFQLETLTQNQEALEHQAEVYRTNLQYQKQKEKQLKTDRKNDRIAAQSQLQQMKDRVHALLGAHQEQQQALVSASEPASGGVEVR
jgi:hypothetical protein